MPGTVTCRSCGNNFPSGQVQREFAGMCPRCLAQFMASQREGPASGTDQLLEPTTRQCAACGGTYTGESHQCSGGGAKKTAPGRSRLDELPPEAAPHAADPARQLNQYILVKQVGKGGMGAVWKAWDRKLTRWLAIKFLLANEEEDVARFLREAKLAARLSHPNIAHIHEVGEAPAQKPGQPSQPYLAMEYIDGQSLAAAELQLREAVGIFANVAQAVEAAHKAGVVHRDLKPQNIMLTQDKWPFVMDFGLAKSLEGDSSLSVSGAVMGTPSFMPPEQAQGRLDEIDGRSDVYSLGATMFAVLCGRPPFIGASPLEIMSRVCRDTPVPPRKIKPEIPEPLERIVLKAMAREKADRYPSARALEEDLNRFLDDQDVDARGPGPLSLVVRKFKRNRPMILAMLVLLGLAGGAISFFSNRPKPETASKPSEPLSSAVPASDEAAKKVAAWKTAWREQRPRIAYLDFKADDPPPSGPINARLKELKDLPQVEVDDVKVWFEGEVRDAKRDAVAWAARPKAEWLKRTADASHLVAWCDAIEAAVKDVGELRSTVADLGAARQTAGEIARYRGSFRLRVNVMGARVTAIRLGGQSLSLAQDTETPYVQDLDVADYEIELSHPADGSGKVDIRGAANGKTVTVLGKTKSLRVSSD